MKIIVTNDDGIESNGIKYLAKAIAKLGDVYIVAPRTPQSAGSHAMTLHKPLRVDEYPLNVGEKKALRVSGTPADCVLLALDVLVKGKVDLVVSGINEGPNIGSDVIYSGTVAGAREGALNGIPSIAVSLDAYKDFNFDVASKFTYLFAKKILEEKIEDRIYFNINIPNVNEEEIKGVKFVKQGIRTYKDRVLIGKDPFERTFYWIGGKVVDDDEKDTENDAVRNNFIAVTPMSVDLTDYSWLKKLKDWKIQFP